MFYCCGYISSLLVSISSCIALICLLVRYRLHFSTLNYVNGTCIVDRAIYCVQYACDCGVHCRSAYPCLLIYVKINDTRATGLVSASTRTHSYDEYPNYSDSDLDGNSLTDTIDLQWPVPLYENDLQQIDVLQHWDNDSIDRVSILLYLISV